MTSGFPARPVRCVVNWTSGGRITRIWVVLNPEKLRPWTAD